MNVKIINIDVPILSFDEKTNTITTGQVPLSLRQHISIVLKERKPKGDPIEYLLTGVVEIDNKDYLAEYYLIRNPSTLFTIPYEENDHHITKALKLEESRKNFKPTSQLKIKLIKRL